jgi:hypothetical protein
MRAQSVEPVHVAGNNLRVDELALLAAGQATTTVVRVLLVLRGTSCSARRRRVTGTGATAPWQLSRRGR